MPPPTSAALSLQEHYRCRCLSVALKDPGFFWSTGAAQAAAATTCIACVPGTIEDRTSCNTEDRRHVIHHSWGPYNPTLAPLGLETSTATSVATLAQAVMDDAELRLMQRLDALPVRHVCHAVQPSWTMQSLGLGDAELRLRKGACSMCAAPSPPRRDDGIGGNAPTITSDSLISDSARIFAFGEDHENARNP